MLSDIISAVLNSSVLSSVLKKKHNAIAYHQVREAIASKLMKFVYVRHEENLSNILIKPLRNEKSFDEKVVISCTRDQ